MPRDKEGQADQADAASADADHTCQLCHEDVDVEEDHIKGMCSSCGVRRYHTDCIMRLMIAKTKDVSNSAQAGKLKTYAQKRPAHQFALQCGRCPVKTASGEDCPGHIVGAEQIRPQKQAPVAPPPPQPPPRGGRGGAQQTGNPAAPMMPRAAKLRGAGSWTKQARPSPRVTLGPAEPAVGASGELRDRLGVLLPAAGEPGAGGDKPKKQRRHGRAASTLTFARGTRPDKLKLCSNWQDCRAHGCVFAHSQEELAGREAEWEEAERLEAKRKEKEEAERQRAALEEDFLDRQAWQQLGEHGVGPFQEESVLLLSEHAISSLKAFKHSYCINSLMEMGFDPASAQAASLATGAAVEAAAEVLAVGALEDLSEPPREVDISRELDRLLATASLMGATAADVEAQLQAFGGNWEAVEEALLHQAGGGAEARGVEGHQEAGAAGAAAATHAWAAGYGATTAAAAMQGTIWDQASSFGTAAPGPAAAAPNAAAAYDTGTAWAVSEDFGLPSELAAPVAGSGFAGAGMHSSSIASATAGGQYDSTAQHSAAVSQLASASEIPGALPQPASFTPPPAPAQIPPGPPTPAIAAGEPAIVPPLGAPDPEGGRGRYQAWVQEAMARLGLQDGSAEAAGGVAWGPAVTPGAIPGDVVETGAPQLLGQGVTHEGAAGIGDVDWAAVLGGAEVAPAALEAGRIQPQAEQAPAQAAAPAVSAVGLDWSATKQPAQYAMRAVAGQQQAAPEQQDAEDLQNMLALLCG